MSSILRYAVLNDIHFPYENKTCYSVALKILSHVKPSHIYLNGDIGEFLSVTNWPRHPDDRNVNLMSEINYINKKFDELQRLFPDTPVTLIEGNHCYRFFRYIRDVAPQLWGLIDCPSLLKFPDRPNWKFVTYGPDQLVKCGEAKLYLRHEPLGGGRTSAKQTAENAYVDIGFGHTHTYQTHVHKKFGPKPFITKAYSLGYLGDKSRNVFDYRGTKDNWVEGITIVDCNKASGDYVLHFIDMRKLPILFDGQLFDAR